MNTENETKNICINLTKIWEQYEGKFNNPVINEIVAKSFVYSKSERNDIVFFGINPSYNGKLPEPYNVHELNKGYYKKFHSIANFCEMQSNWTYLDLFYFRATKQNDLSLFLKDEKGLKFLCEQLTLTQKILEEIKPKLILVFNKRSHDFWGKKINKDVTPYLNVWMGYDFKPLQMNSLENNYELKLITGLVNSEERIAKDIKETNLKGTLVYFLDFFQYTKKEEKVKIYENIKKIIQSEEYKNNR